MEGLHPRSILTSPRPYFAFLLPREMAFPPRFRGSEARSDHDLVVSLAIPCIRNMLRERWHSMRRPWVITASPPVRERRRRCWYAAPFRRFARLVSIIGCISIRMRLSSCAGRSWPSLCFDSANSASLSDPTHSLGKVKLCGDVWEGDHATARAVCRRRRFSVFSHLKLTCMHARMQIS